MTTASFVAAGLSALHVFGRKLRCEQWRFPGWAEKAVKGNGFPRVPGHWRETAKGQPRTEGSRMIKGWLEISLGGVSY